MGCFVDDSRPHFNECDCGRIEGNGRNDGIRMSNDDVGDFGGFFASCQVLVERLGQISASCQVVSKLPSYLGLCDRRFWEAGGALFGPWQTALGAECR